MDKETGYIVTTFRSILEGQPWFGRAVMDILKEINPGIVHKKPNKEAHSLNELLWHMNTWAEFTLNRLNGDKEKDLSASEELDWREIDPAENSWEKGVAEFKNTHDRIIANLQTKKDDFLSGKVDYREYNFRFLLNGLIQHDIYHLGQIAYLKKLLS